MNRMAAMLAAGVAIFCFSVASVALSAGAADLAQHPAVHHGADDNPHLLLPVDASDASPFAEHLRAAQAALGEYLFHNSERTTRAQNAPPSEEEKNAAFKAVRLYLEALQLADFTDTSALRQLFGPIDRPLEWTALADCCGEGPHLIQTLVQKIVQCPPRQASYVTLDLISKVYLDLLWWSDLTSMRTLASTLADRQPHLLRYGDPDRLLRGLKLHQATADAAHFAQAIALAKLREPGVPDPKGFGDRVLEYGNQLLQSALMHDADDFMAKLDKAVALEPDDESRIVFWLKAHAALGTLGAPHLKALQKWGPLTRARAAIIASNVSDGKLPPDLFDPWLKECLPRILANAAASDEPEDPDQLLRDIAQEFRLLQSPAMAAFVRGHLHGWIENLKRDEDDFYPEERCRFLASLSRRFGSPSDELEVFNRWIGMGYFNAGPEGWRLEGQLESMTRAAAAASPQITPRLGVLLAKLLADLCRPNHLPEMEPARHVLHLLLVTSQHETFNSLCGTLERAEKEFISEGDDPNETAPPRSLLRGLVVEMRALQDLLLHRPHHLPLAIAWTRAAESPQTPPQIAWEFTAPIIAPPGFPSDRNDWPGASAPNWQPGHGLRSPLLEALAGSYDVIFELGDTPDHCQKIAEVTAAKAHGVTTLPQPVKTCGYLRSIVRDRLTGEEFASPARLYSLEPPLLASGPEPVPQRCGLPYVIQAPNDARTSVRLSALDRQQTYLLTVWTDISAEDDGDDEFPQESRMIELVTTAGHDLNHCMGRYVLDCSMDNTEANPRVNACFRSDWVVPARDWVTDALGFSNDPVVARPPISHIAEIREPGSEREPVPLYQLRPFHGVRITGKE